MMWKWLMILCAICSTVVNAQTKVLILAGSTRADSVNKKLAIEAADFARQLDAEVTTVDLSDYPIPFYDADLEAKAGMPAKARELRQLMKRSQVIFIASPEYNSSVSAVLKNAIDWASRNEEGGSSRDAFSGKKFVLMSASPGSSGGARGLVHLRTIIEDIGGTVLPTQLVVPRAYDAFDTAGELKDPEQKAALQQLVQQAVK